MTQCWDKTAQYRLELVLDLGSCHSGGGTLKFLVEAGLLHKFYLYNTIAHTCVRVYLVVIVIL